MKSLLICGMRHFKLHSFIALLYLCMASLSYGQKYDREDALSSYFTHRNELGVNITNVLGNVLSLNPNNINSPYGIIFRRHLGSTSLRLGLDVGIASTEDFTFGNNVQTRKKINEKTINSRIGYEWHLPINKKFMFSYGLDIIANRFSDDSDLTESSFNSGGTVSKSFKSEERTFGYGGGPVLRFDFRFNERLSLSTESTLYYIRSTSTDKLFDRGQLLLNDKSNTNNLSLVLPQSLFVNLAF